LHAYTVKTTLFGDSECLRFWPSFGCAFFIVGGAKMRRFFVDYENVSGGMLEGISFAGLKKTDEIIFFYNKTVRRITFTLHQELEAIKAKKEYILIEPGRGNALDFQLSSYLGSCIAQKPEAEYYIVSRDCGYDCVCRFWQNRDINVKRIEKLHTCKKTGR